MKKLKIHKFDLNIIYISIFVALLLGAGIYFLSKKYFEPKFTILPIETELDKELNKELVKILDEESKQKIYSKNWTWSRTEIGSAQKISPFGSEFVMKIDVNGNFTSTSDCNNLSGKVFILNNNIYFRDIAQTKKFCPKTREAAFISNLEEVVKFRFDEKERLVLEFKNNEGFMLFEGR